MSTEREGEQELRASIRALLGRWEHRDLARAHEYAYMVADILNPDPSGEQYDIRQAFMRGVLEGASAMRQMILDDLRPLSQEQGP